MGLAKTLLQNVREMRKGIEHTKIQNKIKEANERPKNIKTQPKIRLDKKVKSAIQDQMKVEKTLQNGGQRISREKSDVELKASSKKSSNKPSKVPNSPKKSQKTSNSKNLISYEKFVENTPETKIVVTNPTSPDLENLEKTGNNDSLSLEPSGNALAQEKAKNEENSTGNKKLDSTRLKMLFSADRE